MTFPVKPHTEHCPGTLWALSRLCGAHKNTTLVHNESESAGGAQPIKEKSQGPEGHSFSLQALRKNAADLE